MRHYVFIRSIDFVHIDRVNPSIIIYYPEVIAIVIHQAQFTASHI